MPPSLADPKGREVDADVERFLEGISEPSVQNAPVAGMSTTATVLQAAPPRSVYLPPEMDEGMDCRACGEWIEFEPGGRRTEHGCCACQDTGRVRYELPRTAPGFGKGHLCPNCQGGATRETPEAKEESFMRFSRIPRRYEHERIETWEPADGRERMHAANYAAYWPPRTPILTLLGTTGLGKSHLACGVLRHAWEKHGKRGRFYFVPALLDRYRAANDAEQSTESPAQIDAELRRMDLVVLDDIGKQRATSYADERLFAFVDERSRELRPLIVTGNCTLLELPGPLARRLADAKYATVVEFDRRGQR